MSQFTIDRDFSNLDNSERAEILKTLIEKFVNSASHDEISQFGKSLVNQHRTLQQQTFGVFLSFSQELARHHDEGFYDLRNEYACKVSKKLMSDIGIAAVPFV